MATSKLLLLSLLTILLGEANSQCARNCNCGVSADCCLKVKENSPAMLIGVADVGGCSGKTDYNIAIHPDQPFYSAMFLLKSTV